MYYLLTLVWHHSIDCSGRYEELHKPYDSKNILLNTDDLDTELINWIETDTGNIAYDYKFWNCTVNGCTIHDGSVGHKRRKKDQDIQYFKDCSKTSVGKFLLKYEYKNMKNETVNVNGDVKFITKNIWVLMKDDVWMKFKKHNLKRTIDSSKECSKKRKITN